jgi:hypothetical protein
MEAAEAKVQKVLEGSKQFVGPALPRRGKGLTSPLG